MVRVGSLYDMTLVKEPHIDSRTGQTPEQQLQAIFKAAGPCTSSGTRWWSSWRAGCGPATSAGCRWRRWTPRSASRWRTGSGTRCSPSLSPGGGRPPPLPHLSNKTLNVMLRLEGDGQEALGLIPVPQSLPPPYFVLRERGLRYILTEDVLLAHADRMFPAFSIPEPGGDLRDPECGHQPGGTRRMRWTRDYRQHMRKIVKSATAWPRSAWRSRAAGTKRGSTPCAGG